MSVNTELPNLQGYVRYRELATVVITALGGVTASDLIARILRALSEDTGWWAGGNAEMVAFILGTVATALGTRAMALRAINQGSPVTLEKSEDARLPE